MFKTTKIIFNSFILIFFIFLLSGCKKEEKSIFYDDIKAFNEKLDFKLYYIGKKENLLNLNVEYVDSVKNLELNSNNKHTFIIINNLDKKLTFDVEELKTLKTKIVEKGYSLYYFGTTEISKFQNGGLYNSPFLEPGLSSFGYVNQYGRYIRVAGPWHIKEVEISKKNKTLFLQLMLLQFKFAIKNNL